MISDKPNSVDSSFSHFMLGLTIGIVGALLLGTEDGRKASRKMLDSIADSLDQNDNLLKEAKNLVIGTHKHFEEKVVQTDASLPPYQETFDRPLSPPQSDSPHFHNQGQPLKPPRL